MIYPHMLVMRNEPNGMIWQAYRVENDIEKRILTRNARKNGFIVFDEPDGCCSEEWPGWRETEGWKKLLEKEKASV